MAHPRYFGANKRIVPSVTTVLGAFKESGGLVHWAYRLGLEGRDMEEERKGAASAGSLAHHMVENDFHGRDPEVGLRESYKGPPDLYDARRELAQASYENYLRWKKAVDMAVVATETSLVHDELRFGGTPDFVATAWDKLVLGDLKTSNKVYEEYLVQCAAYAILWEEGRPNGNLAEVPLHLGERIEEIVILRLAKDSAAFQFHSFRGEIVEEARAQFLAFRDCYERRKQIKKAVGQ